MRSSFVAFKARVYSRARSKGCWVGSRFLVSLLTLEPGAWADEAGRESALIFIFWRCEWSGGCALGAPRGEYENLFFVSVSIRPDTEKTAECHEGTRESVFFFRVSAASATFEK